MIRLALMTIILSWSVSAQTQAQAQTLAQPAKYHVDSANSYIHVYTDTGGMLSVFAHKHLIAITQIQGEVLVSGQGSFAHLSFRPNEFLVDDNTERARAADPEYREPVDTEIQADTKTNMLSNRLLDAGNYPEISLDIQLDQLSSAPLLTVTVHLLGREQRLQVPAILRVNENQIEVSGYFEISHAMLGLKPFTAMGGLLRVAEGMRVQFDISARVAAAT